MKMELKQKAKTSLVGFVYVLMMCTTAFLWAGTAMCADITIPLIVKERTGTARTQSIVSYGIPFAESSDVRSIQKLRITDEQGNELSSQFSVISRYDGLVADTNRPIRTVLANFIIDIKAGEEKTVYIKNDGISQTVGQEIATDNGDHIALSTGILDVRISKENFNLFDEVTVDTDEDGVADERIISSNEDDGIKIEYENQIYTANLNPEEIIIEENGPVRAIVKVKGYFRDKSGNKLLPPKGDNGVSYTVRFKAYKNKSFVKVDYTLENENLGWSYQNNDPIHNIYITSNYITTTAALGSTKQIKFGDYSDQFTTGSYSLVQQEKSDGTKPEYLWEYAIEKNGQNVKKGEKFDSFADISDSEKGVMVSSRWFWQNHPKGININGNEIRFDILPDTGKEHRILGGIWKTTEMLYYFHGKNADHEEKLSEIKQRLIARCSDTHYAKTDFFVKIPPAAIDTSYTFAAGEPLQPAIDHFTNSWLAKYRSGYITHGSYNNTLVSVREGRKISRTSTSYSTWYGWLEFGDIPARRDGYTSQHYDWSFVTLSGFLRFGDDLMFDMGEEMISHKADIIVLHDSYVKNSSLIDYEYHGGQRYESDGLLSYEEHYSKSVSAAPRRASHFWTKGLMLQYLLTGDKRYKDSFSHCLEHAKRVYTRRPSNNAETRNQSRLIDALVNGYKVIGDAEYLDIAYNIFSERMTQHEDGNGRAWISMFDDNHVWLNYDTIMIEPLIKLYHILNSAEQTDRAKEVETFLLKYALWARDTLFDSWADKCGSYRNDKKEYFPYCLKLSWHIGDDDWTGDSSTGLGQYTMQYADTFTFVYEQTGDGKWLDLARNLFKDYHVYGNGGLWKEVSNSRKVAGFISGEPNTAYLKIGKTLTKPMFYLYREWLESNKEAPVPGFTIQKNLSEVKFFDTSENGPTSWAWDFNSDGVIDSTEKNPTYIYEIPGSYTVTLTVENSSGKNILTKTDCVTIDSAVWGNASVGTEQSTKVHSRAMGGMSPNADNMVATSVAIFLGAQMGDVRMALYSGGTLSNPSGAKLIWDAGTINSQGVKGWYTIKHPAGGILVDKNTPTWIAWKQDSGVATYHSSSVSQSGDFQNDRGRNDNSFDINPDVKFPSTYADSGSFSSYWYSTYLTYTVNPQLTAGFTTDTTSGKPPLTVTFSDRSTGEPDSWQWDFNNDGVIDSTESDPVYTFTEQGVYTVSLTISKGNNTDTTIQKDYIEISGAEVWGKSDPGYFNTQSSHSRSMGGVSPDKDDLFIESISIYLGSQTGEVRLGVYTGGSLDNPSGADLLWDAGVVNATGKLGWYTIDHPSGGVYLPGKTPTWLAWKRDTGVAVYYSNNSKDAGDFQTALGRNHNAFDKDPDVEFPSSYTGNSLFTNYWYSIYISYSTKPGIMAKFDADTTVGKAPMTVSFTDESNGNPSLWEWDFNNDGNIDSNEQNPVYTFDKPGVYTITMTAERDDTSDTMTRHNLVRVLDPSEFKWGNTSACDIKTDVSHSMSMGGISPDTRNMILKTVSVYLGQQAGDVRLGVYAGGTVDDPAGSILLWDAGIINSNGNEGWYTLPHPDNGISIPANLPIWIAWKKDKGTEVYFSQDAEDAGDFTTSQGANANTFDQNPDVEFSATYYGDNVFENKWYSIYLTYEIEPDKADFETQTPDPSNPLRIKFTDKSPNGPIAWEWDFDNDNIVDSREQNPTFTFASAGIYDISLTVHFKDSDDPVTIILPITMEVSSSSTKWGMTEPGEKAVSSPHSRAMGGIPPNKPGLVLESISIYLGGQTGDIRLAAYSGGTLDDPSEATLIWDAGTINPNGIKGWYTIKHEDGGVPVEDDTPLWLAWKKGPGVFVYYTSNKSKAGDFASSPGRNNNNFSTNPETPFPADYGTKGSVTDYRFSIFMSYSSSDIKADFSADKTSGSSPLTVKFTDTSSNTPLSWKWDFDNDGITDSTSKNPEHTFESSGAYTVSLTVENAAGKDTIVKNDYIRVDGITSWGITTPGNLYTAANHFRAMSGTSPDIDNMIIKSVSIYIGTQTGEVRLAVYKGGALDNPTGATLLWDAGIISADGIKGWHTINHLEGDEPLPRNTPLWLVWKKNAGAVIYCTMNSSSTGDFQKDRGRCGFAMDFDPSKPYPDNLSASYSFDDFWYSIYISYATLTGNSAPETYYVGKHGNGSNPGSSDEPFLTIQKCADTAESGDTCLISEGIYRETVVPKNDGIIFKSSSNDRVIISGTESIPASTWESWQGNIWRTPIDWSINIRRSTGIYPQISNNQVFVDGKMMVEARWPDINPADVTSQTSIDGIREDSAKADGAENTTEYSTTFIDDELKNAGNFWEGGKINFGTGHNYIYTTANIVSKNDTSLKLVCSPDPGAWDKRASLAGEGKYRIPRAGNYYYLWGKLEALDHEGEWFIDSDTYANYADSIVHVEDISDKDTFYLYLWMEQDADPKISEKVVEVKKRMWAFDLRGRSEIEIDGIDIFACGILTNHETEYTTIKNMDAEYLAHFQEIPPFYYIRGTVGIQFAGSHNTIKDSNLAYSAGQMLYLQDYKRENRPTTDNNVINNVIRNFGYTGSGIAVNGDNPLGKDPHQVFQNTIFNGGRYAVDLGENMDVMYNDIYKTHLQITDLGAIYAFGSDGMGSDIGFNLVHDINAQVDSSQHKMGGKGIHLDDDSYNFNIFRNIVWNTTAPGINVVGVNGTNIDGFGRTSPSNREVINNTVAGTLLLRAKEDVNGYDQHLNGTRFINNTSFRLTLDEAGSYNRRNFTIPADSFDIDTQNFSLPEGSPVIDTGMEVLPYTDNSNGDGPDPGAVEYGSEQFIAGAVLRDQDIANLTIEPRLEANGTITCDITNLPEGRNIPKDFQIKIGEQVSDYKLFITMNYNDHKATARLENISSGSQAGTQPVYMRIGNGEWVQKGNVLTGK
ncbi:PKD domain-containing protein [Desulfobacterales bacterium HSG16]|nr:PKD domain-containing protein [Desulfobacterales bacterium HSG16]